MQNQKNIFGLDVMRATAILMVLSSHTLALFDNPNFKGIDFLHFFGFFGVEIFFVLSGFLIGNILYKNYVNANFSFSILKKFWIRRWLRTLPNYFLVLGINISLVIFFNQQLPERLGSYFIFLQNISVQPLFFNESWSLSIEEYAYLLFPLFLFFFVKKQNKKHVFLFVTIFFLVFFLILKCYYHYTVSIPKLDYWNLHLKAVLAYRIDAIIYGVLGAWLINNHHIFFEYYKHAFFISGLTILFFLFFGIGILKLTIENNSFFWDILYLPITSIAVLFSIPFFNSWTDSHSVFKKTIVFISKTSYSIYLFHYSIILYIYKYVLFDKIQNSFQSILYVLGYLFCVLLVSFLVYNFFEKPILKWRNKRYHLL